MHCNIPARHKHVSFCVVGANFHKFGALSFEDFFHSATLRQVLRFCLWEPLETQWMAWLVQFAATHASTFGLHRFSLLQLATHLAAGELAATGLSPSTRLEAVSKEA